MRVYFLSPEGVPPNPVLFPTFIETFRNKGVGIADKVEDATVILWDMHTRISDYNQGDIEYILSSGKPIASWDEFDKGAMSDLDWPHPLTPQQEALFMYSNTVKSVHFCRLLNKRKHYNYNVYPFEKGIIYEQPIVSADELFNREYDVCFIANSAPQREKLKEILEADGRLKCNIILGQPKIPFEAWLGEHRKAKMFITWSAGGWTDERVQALFSISAQIREDTDQLLLNDFTDMVNCVKLQSVPTNSDIDTLVSIVNDKQALHDIYINGYNHVKEYYSHEYLATNVLGILKKHGIQ